MVAAFRVPWWRTLLVAGVPLLLALFVVARAHAQEASGTSGEDKTLLLTLLWLGIGVFVLLEAGFLAAVVRFRARGDESSGRLASAGSLALPVIAVVALFGASIWAVLDSEGEGEPPDAMTIRVNAFQFQWEFAYDLADLGSKDPVDGNGEVLISGTLQEWPTLVLPVGEQVELRMTSNDVLHSLHIPGIANKLDITAGQERTYLVTGNEAGRFEGQCAELCGVGHLEMRFHVEVLEREQFDAWIRAQAEFVGRAP